MKYVWPWPSRGQGLFGRRPIANTPTRAHPMIAAINVIMALSPISIPGEIVGCFKLQGCPRRSYADVTILTLQRCPRAMSTALVPPKAKELDITVVMVSSRRAPLAT